MATKLLIERKGLGGYWEVVAYPRNIEEEAKEILRWLQREEQQKRFKGKFRLIRETREIIE